MPPDITIRPYVAADEDALLALWNATMWADPIDTVAWRGRYLLDPGFDPAHCLVAAPAGETVGDLVGFVLGFSAGDVNGTEAWVVAFGVAEASRRQGIGTALMDALETSWRADGVRTVHIGPWIPHYLTPGVDADAYPAALPFLTGRGAVEKGHSVSMKASLTGYRTRSEVAPLRESLAERGIAIRPAEATDILPLLAFLHEHFPHWRADAAGVLRERFAGDPRGVTIHVATDRGAVIGYAQTRHERFGPFGVDASYRGQGVGAVLLARTLHAMRAQGWHSAWFLWTSDRTAKLYGEHGFEPVRRFHMIDLVIT